MKYWCSKENKTFNLENPIIIENAETSVCPNCAQHRCNWGPVVEPDTKQEKQLHAIFDAKPAEREDMIHHATRVGPPRAELPSKYHIEITAIDSLTSEPRKVIVDVYAIQFALEQTPQVAHSFKKLWIAGKRSGGKSYKQDIMESKVQLEMELNRIELEERLDR